MPAFDFRTHARTARDSARIAGTALVNWWRAVSIEALCVAVLWWLGLALLGIPLAPLWALIGGLMTFVPNFGGVITVIFPVMMVCSADATSTAWACPGTLRGHRRH